MTILPNGVSLLGRCSKDLTHVSCPLGEEGKVVSCDYFVADMAVGSGPKEGTVEVPGVSEGQRQT
jgi:hypothetical protein